MAPPSPVPLIASAFFSNQLYSEILENPQINIFNFTRSNGMHQHSDEHKYYNAMDETQKQIKLITNNQTANRSTPINRLPYFNKLNEIQTELASFRTELVSRGITFSPRNIETGAQKNMNVRRPFESAQGNTNNLEKQTTAHSYVDEDDRPKASIGNCTRQMSLSQDLGLDNQQGKAQATSQIVEHKNCTKLRNCTQYATEGEVKRDAGSSVNVEAPADSGISKVSGGVELNADLNNKMFWEETVEISRTNLLESDWGSIVHRCNSIIMANHEEKNSNNNNTNNRNEFESDKHQIKTLRTSSSIDSHCSRPASEISIPADKAATRRSDAHIHTKNNGDFKQLQFNNSLFGQTNVDIKASFTDKNFHEFNNEHDATLSSPKWGIPSTINASIVQNASMVRERMRTRPLHSLPSADLEELEPEVTTNLESSSSSSSSSSSPRLNDMDQLNNTDMPAEHHSRSSAIDQVKQKQNSNLDSEIETVTSGTLESTRTKNNGCKVVAGESDLKRCEELKYESMKVTDVEMDGIDEKNGSGVCVDRNSRVVRNKSYARQSEEMKRVEIVVGEKDQEQEQEQEQNKRQKEEEEQQQQQREEQHQQRQRQQEKQKQQAEEAAEKEEEEAEEDEEEEEEEEDDPLPPSIDETEYLLDIMNSICTNQLSNE